VELHPLLLVQPLNYCCWLTLIHPGTMTQLHWWFEATTFASEQTSVPTFAPSVAASSWACHATAKAIEQLSTWPLGLLHCRLLGCFPCRPQRQQRLLQRAS
jgi:hypothetical protein